MLSESQAAAPETYAGAIAALIERGLGGGLGDIDPESDRVVWYVASDPLLGIALQKDLDQSMRKPC